MKEYILLNMEMIISILTAFITFIMGFISKRYKYINNNLIPFQNAIIMLISVIIYYYATGDFSLVVASGSPVATLIYDFIHNLKKEE